MVFVFYSMKLHLVFSIFLSFFHSKGDILAGCWVFNRGFSLLVDGWMEWMDDDSS